MHEERNVQVAMQSGKMHACVVTVPLFFFLHKAPPYPPPPQTHHAWGAKDDELKSNPAPHTCVHLVKLDVLDLHKICRRI